MIQIHQQKKKVCFSDTVTVEEITSHHEWTRSERLSVWYTDDDYTDFYIKEHFDAHSTLPISPKAQSSQRLIRRNKINTIRVLVLGASKVLSLAAEKNHKHDETWLAEFYHKQSEQCYLEARQRGIENDLLLMNIKLQDVSKLLLGAKIEKNTASQSRKPIARTTKRLRRCPSYIG